MQSPDYHFKVEPLETDARSIQDFPSIWEWTSEKYKTQGLGEGTDQVQLRDTCYPTRYRAELLKFNLLFAFYSTSKGYRTLCNLPHPAQQLKSIECVPRRWSTKQEGKPTSASLWLWSLKLASYLSETLAKIGPTGDLIIANPWPAAPLMDGQKYRTSDWGDNFSINVFNSLNDSSIRQSTSIHWHGLFQRGTS
ncbi:hypothetical protein IW261DRAFT_1595442 [Armillaria novae-zelandiae]|uniref:Plastocyanin-like domain-containing protein n=1 Tax=Armillaria novae-zelandiae TaxID=153914 RepID=A0AA39P1W3_9AGAR|nr:hypothetical protein IW261DRAFT_1595442 [Armillaria novae-zelandiae]